jgi:hypothetical protein
MTLLLVPATFILLFLTSYGKCRNASAGSCDWRRHFLEACLWMGSFIVLVSEALSLFHSLATIPITIAWLCAAVGALSLGLRGGAIRMGWLGLKEGVRSLDRFDRVAIAAVFIFVATLFIIAWLSPPNTMDSLQYHMARVVHWAENRSLQPYATQYLPQLVNPIGGELVILNLRLLYGTDHAAGLVQWWAMMGSLVGASFLAAQLGAGRRGQWAALCFVASLPMGIMQATSTQNDYVAALWMVCLASYAVEAWRRDLTAREWTGLGIALGLGLATKGTFYPLAFPWILVVGGRVLLRRVPRTWARAFGLVVVPVLALNVGFWTRSWLAFGSPLGPSTWVTSKTSADMGLPETFSKGILNLMLNFATPSEQVNDRILGWALEHLHVDDDTAGKVALIWGWNHEDSAGNPIHLLLIPTTILGLLLKRRRLGFGVLSIYITATLAVFASVSIAVVFDTYGIRYQLPFLVLWGPAFGVAASQLGERRIAGLASMLLLVMAVPWLLFNRSRPLIGMKRTPEPLAIPCLPGLGCDFGSLLLEPPSRILFSNVTYLRYPYEDLTNRIRATSCRSVGLRIDSHDPEYLFWWLLEAPQSGFRLETVDPLPGLEEYLPIDFKPCAIICTTCGDRMTLHGLRFIVNHGNASLFVDDAYQPGEDS